MHEIIKKLQKKLPLLAFDIGSIPIAWYGAYWLRYNLQDSPARLITQQSFFALLILMGVQVSCFYYFRVYRCLWRYTSINDIVRIIKAVAAACFMVIPIFYLTTLVAHVPRSVLPLYAMNLVTLLCSGRMLQRLYRDRSTVSWANESIKRVLVIGAGQAGESLVRDLKRTGQYLPVGLLDDDSAKRGMEIHGIRVLGEISELATFTEVLPIDFVFIAIPSANSVLMRRIVALCEKCNIQFRTLPNLIDLVEGKVAVNDLREVKIEDLLGRDQVHLQLDKIFKGIAGKRVIVTGGGGSIGKELCRQILTYDPQALLIIDNSEYNAYQVEREFRQLFPKRAIEVSLNSVTDEPAMDYLFHNFRPDLVFHAAAYKHVPLLEDQVRVAVQNNILGTQTVAQMSVEVGAEKFVLISTDKAVNPTNVMGATKRVAEIYCQNLNDRVSTEFITVRFGNVLGSAGSVVPLFRKQIKQGGPLTVTHPDMQRYFMTIPEACQLILQAMVNGLGGEIFVLDMGEPIKISYLAEQMIRLSGKEPGKDIKIVYTGLRPGEKLFEELFHESEALVKTEHEKLFKARFREIPWLDLMKAMQLLQEAAKGHHETQLHALIKSLVPEFSVGHAVV